MFFPFEKKKGLSTLRFLLRLVFSEIVVGTKLIYLDTL